MIRTPSEILDKVAQDRQADATRILDRIATILEEEFVGNPIDLWIHEIEANSHHIIEIVTTTLYSKGWSIKTAEKITDARNGDSVMFIITPIDSTDLLIRPNQTPT